MMRQGKGSAFQMPRLGLPKGKQGAGMKRAGVLVKTAVLVTVLGLGLTGCGFGKSKFNPFNWWSTPQQGTPVALYTAPVDPRGLVDQITLLKIDPYPSGVIVRATGVPATQGYWDASLVALPTDGSGKLVFEFRIAPPLSPAAAGSQPSREVTVATTVTTFNLQDVTSLEVRSASNAMTAHR